MAYCAGVDFVGVEAREGIFFFFLISSGRTAFMTLLLDEFGAMTAKRSVEEILC